MDKNIKIFAVLAVLCLLTMPASAKALPRHSIVRDQYIVKVSGTNSIQVDGITGDSTSQAIAAKYLVTKKGIDTAGRDVMTLAKENNMKVRRPTFDVKNEIGTHAIMYSKTKHAMPVDIGINIRLSLSGIKIT